MHYEIPNSSYEGKFSIKQTKKKKIQEHNFITIMVTYKFTKGEQSTLAFYLYKLCSNLIIEFYSCSSDATVQLEYAKSRLSDRLSSCLSRSRAGESCP